MQRHWSYCGLLVTLNARARGGTLWGEVGFPTSPQSEGRREGLTACG